MGSRETPVKQLNADILFLTENKLAADDMAAGQAGRIKLSGAKLYIDDGSNWNIVTSA